MKEVKKCSISGIAFTLDADAYALLSRYLDSLKATYAETADGDEIVADIEARIAELILSQQENSRVVETPLLRQIISQMGTAEDISSESETDAAKKQPRIPRRLYRDTENARLGGVCAGLGRYFDVDPTWVRLTLFAPLLLLILVEVLPFSGTLSTFFSNLFGVFVLGYFIMWFAVPAARSARQKLEMEGEPITVRSIREKTVRDSETNSDVKSIVARVIYALGQLALIVIKIFIGFFIFGLTFAACILLIVLFALIFGDPGGSGTLSIAGWTMTTTAMGVMGLLTVLIPLLLLIYILFCLIASRKPSGRATLIVFLLWILTIVATGGLILREYGGEQRHRLHELFDEARDELRDREIDRMQEWVAADTVSVIATEPAPQTAPASDSAHRITIKGPKKQKVDIRVTDRYTNEEVLDEIRRHVRSEVAPRSTRLKPSSIPPAHPIVRAGLALGRTTYGSPTTSDQALLDIPSLKLGVGDSARSHSADEFVGLSEIREGIDLYIRMLSAIL